MSETTLLLNTSFEPLRIVSWQKAFILRYQGKVEVLEEYVTTVHTVSSQYRIPAVIRLTRWVNLKRTMTKIRFCRSNVYLRDNHRCQYCLKPFPERDLTLDHVIPVVRGGRKSWENIVTACKRCNQKKGDKTPEELGILLKPKPQAPVMLPGFIGNIRAVSTPLVWKPYLITKED